MNSPAFNSRFFHSKSFIISFLLLTFMIIFGDFLFAQADKKEVIRKYESAIAKSEELDIYGQDVLEIIPKIRRAGQLLLKDSFVQADELLTAVLRDLELVEKNRPNRWAERWRLEWLEVIYELVQKYALLALLAILFVRMPLFGKLLGRGDFTWMGSFYAGVFFGSASLLFTFMDLSRYGPSAWSFFDLPFVFTVISGLVGGWGTGLFLGLWNGGLRLLVNVNLWPHLCLMVTVGILAGLLKRNIHPVKKVSSWVIAAGISAGILHGIFIYGKTLPELAWVYFAMTVLFLALLESGAIYLFMGIVASIMRERERRQMESDLLSTKLLFLQAQIRPHFIFNALNAISSICSRENAVQARELVGRLAGFLREAIRRQGATITLKEEMEYIQNYLEIEKVRFQDRLKVVWDVPVENGAWQTPVPILALQPIVENAVLHGIGKMPEGGEVKISISESAEGLQVAVSDTGPGIPENVREIILGNYPDPSEKAGSIGMRNIQERLERLYGKGRGMKIERLPSGGTKVSMLIPKKQIAQKEKFPEGVMQ